MRNKLGDLIWGQSANGNSISQVLAQIKRDVGLLKARPVIVASLDEISSDLGTVTAGRFIASSDADPLTVIDSDTEGNAPDVTGSGVVIDGDGIPVANGGDKAGIIGYGASSVVGFYDTVAGKRVSGQGAVVQDEDGMTTNGYFFGIKHNVTDVASIDKRLQIGPVGISPKPLAYENGFAFLVGNGAQSELLSNPDFETGDLTNWTASHTGTGSDPSAQSSVVHDGTYAVQLPLLTTTTLSSVLSDNIAVTAGTAYAVSAWLRVNINPQTDNCRIFLNVDWFDGGGNIGSSLWEIRDWVAIDEWFHILNPCIAPTGAINAKVQVAITRSTSAQAITLYADDLSFKLESEYGEGIVVSNDFVSPGGPVHILTKSGQVSTLHYGDYAGYVSYANDTSNNTLYSRTIKQNSPGTKGIVGRYIWGWHQTNGSVAANFSATPNIYLGSSNIFSPTVLGLSANANRHSWALYILTIENSGSAAGQVCSLVEIYASNQTVAQATAGATATTKTYYATATEDFSAGDIAVALKVQMNTANAQYSVNTYDAEGIGPYYGA